MSAETILDAALLCVMLPSRLVLLDDYAFDLDDTPSVRACKMLAVRAARLGDEDGTLLALQHAAAHVGGYADEPRGWAA
jgi:hypothetical protein